MRIRYIQLPDSEIENPLPHHFDVVGLEFQPDRFPRALEFALIGLVPVENPNMEVISQANVVRVLSYSHEFGTEDIEKEFTNSFPLGPRDYVCGVSSESYLCHDVLPQLDLDALFSPSITNLRHNQRWVEFNMMVYNFPHQQC